MSVKSTHRYDLTMAAVSQPPMPASARTKETCIYMPLLANCADGIFFFDSLSIMGLEWRYCSSLAYPSRGALPPSLTSSAT